jgi:aryl-alcohol dehydrogenase-like predicted oxidoreductase
MVMERRLLGKTGLEVSVLGFGGAEIGFEQASEATVKELLSAALDQGLNAIDTAECYVNSEALIGRAIASRRNDFYLFTKCGHKSSNFESAWGRQDIAQSLERSLRSLQTDYVDLLQLHSCSKEILAAGEAVEALQKAKKEGKVRFIGYSGDSEDALYAIKLDVFDTLQTSVSVFDQECLDVTLPAARARNMGVIAKRPIGNAVWRFAEKPGNSYWHDYWERMRVLDYDFVRSQAGHVAETALRFTLSVPGVSTMIVGTTKPGRWKDNADLVAKGKLSQAEFASIREAWLKHAQKDWVGQV